MVSFRLKISLWLKHRGDKIGMETELLGKNLIIFLESFPKIVAALIKEKAVKNLGIMKRITAEKFPGGDSDIDRFAAIQNRFGKRKGVSPSNVFHQRKKNQVIEIFKIII